MRRFLCGLALLSACATSDSVPQLSAEPMGGTVTATSAYMRAETERWRNVIKAANVKLE